MVVRLASSDLRELTASSKTFGSEFRFGPHPPTSLAALPIAARSETLCESIAATLVAACCSVAAGGDEGADGDVVALPDALGLADEAPPWLVLAADPPGVAGLVPLLAVSLSV
jgi:hypothetical protein